MEVDLEEQFFEFSKIFISDNGKKKCNCSFFDVLLCKCIELCLNEIEKVGVSSIFFSKIKEELEYILV